MFYTTIWILAKSGDQACFDVVCAISGISIADVTVNEGVGNATVQVCIPAATNGSCDCYFKY
ncbi:MAG: hypothetical protein IPO48_21095 [Saprospiraceae bacterium]|nr:hypothetical protein [Saprospiraceae bacterium]